MEEEFEYPLVVNGRPEYLKIALEVTSAKLQDLKQTGIACGRYLQVGDWIMGMITPHGVVVMENVTPLPSREHCEKSCRIINKANGYTDLQIKIIMWQYNKNSVLINDEGKRVFLPGMPFHDN